MPGVQADLVRSLEASFFTTDVEPSDQAVHRHVAHHHTCCLLKEVTVLLQRQLIMLSQLLLKEFLLFSIQQPRSSCGGAGGQVALFSVLLQVPLHGGVAYLEQLCGLADAVAVFFDRFHDSGPEIE